MNIIGVDRISDLPDEVLSHILSLLSTKEAVQTCILAKRWRKTWAFMPVLKFSLAEFMRDMADINNYEKRKECEDKLKQFVNGVLENRGPYHLDVFQYQSDIDGNHSEVSFEWLDNVALLMPRVIEVTIARDNAVDFPDSIFSCGSLQNLSLDILNMDGTTFIWPKSINLPSLKILELIGITLEDDFTQKLFSGCPALESLFLCHCDLEFSEISSNVLKKLDLLESWHRKKMQISCPRMDSLVIVCENQEGGISLENMVSLISAEFSLGIERFDFNSDMNLLSGLSNVSTLTLDLCNAEFKVYCLFNYIKPKFSFLACTFGDHNKVMCK